jgi:hypothetical protein
VSRAVWPRSIFTNLKIQTTRQLPAEESPKMPYWRLRPNFAAVPDPTIAEELKPSPLVIGFSLPMRACSQPLEDARRRNMLVGIP